MDRHSWLGVGTAVAAVAVGVGFFLAPAPKRVDPRGAWVTGSDTLVFSTGTSGTFRREPFTAQARESRLCVRTQHHPDCMVVTIAGDSLVMTSGIATLLHPGDTLRVFRRTR